MSQTRLDCYLSAHLIVAQFWTAALDRTLTWKLHFCNSEGDLGESGLDLYFHFEQRVRQALAVRIRRKRSRNAA
jgi:hypothetical protein